MNRDSFIQVTFWKQNCQYILALFLYLYSQRSKRRYHYLLNGQYWQVRLNKEFGSNHPYRLIYQYCRFMSKLSQKFYLKMSWSTVGRVGLIPSRPWNPGDGINRDFPEFSRSLLDSPVRSLARQKSFIIRIIPKWNLFPQILRSETSFFFRRQVYNSYGDLPPLT